MNLNNTSQIDLIGLDWYVHKRLMSKGIMLGGLERVNPYKDWTFKLYFTPNLSTEQTKMCLDFYIKVMFWSSDQQYFRVSCKSLKCYALFTNEYAMYEEQERRFNVAQSKKNV